MQEARHTGDFETEEELLASWAKTIERAPTKALKEKYISFRNISLEKHRARKAREQAGEREEMPKQPDAPKTAEVVQLPFWPDPARGVPNSALRGALFAAVKTRRYMEGELLAVQQGLQIRFTGMQLSQSDLDVWEQALHLARQHPLSTRCEFTAHGFLKALGWAKGKKDHERLKGVFRRLAACAVEITHNRLTYGGSLLEFYRDEDTDRYRLEINPKIKALYDAGFTQIDWQQRQALRRKPLAQWLHGFLASHAEPFPLKVESLMQWSGSGTREVWKFKQNLKTALDELKAIGTITTYEFSGDLVTIYRIPSRSQRKHLTRAKPRRK
jgi:hypothetical protein